MLPISDPHTILGAMRLGAIIEPTPAGPVLIEKPECRATEIRRPVAVTTFELLKTAGCLLAAPGFDSPTVFQLVWWMV